MKLLFVPLITTAAIILHGCGGGGSPSICTPIGSSGHVTSQSAGVQVDQPENAFDGSVSSAAELYSGVSGAGNAIFEAQGVASSATYAGILLGVPSGQLTQVDISTRRNGTVVTTGSAGTHSNGSATACPGICVQQGGQIYMGIEANGTFDEIVATVQFSGTTEDTLVYELCSKSL